MEALHVMAMDNVIIQMDCVHAMKETRDRIVLVIPTIYEQKHTPQISLPLINHSYSFLVNHFEL